MKFLEAAHMQRPRNFPQSENIGVKLYQKLLTSTCHPDSEKQCNDPTPKVHKSLRYGNWCSVHTWFFIVSLNCTKSKVFLGTKMSWIACDIPHVPDSVRIAYCFSASHGAHKLKNYCAFAITRSYWKISAPFFHPSSLLHFRSPTQNINWYTHGYFNLHKLVFLSTLLFFKLSSYNIVIMHLNSTCRLLIKLLHMNVSLPPPHSFPTIAKEIKVFCIKPQNIN